MLSMSGQQMEGFMSKTFKMGFIYFLSISLFLLLRISISMVYLADNYTNWIFSFIGQVILCGFLPIYLYKRWVNSEPGGVIKDFRIKFNIHPLSYLIAILLGFVVFFMTISVSAIYSTIIELFGYQQNVHPGTIYSSDMVLILQIITVAVFPGIFEEILNRGLLMRSLDNIKNERVIIIITGLFFGLFHQNIGQFGYAVFGGIVFAIITLRTGSIIPAMIMHFMHNGISVMLGYASQNAVHIYDNILSILNLAFSNMLTLLFTFGVLAFVLDRAIRLLKSLNAERLSKTKMEERDAYYSSEYDINSYEDEDDYDDDYKPKIRWWEYGFLYASFITMTITTVATFIWGYNL